jgi:magnesium-transporting ATPase (P-type)
VIKYTNFSQEY